MIFSDLKIAECKAPATCWIFIDFPRIFSFFAKSVFFYLKSADCKAPATCRNCCRFPKKIQNCKQLLGEFFDFGKICIRICQKSLTIGCISIQETFANTMFFKCFITYRLAPKKFDNSTSRFPKLGTEKAGLG